MIPKETIHKAAWKFNPVNKLDCEFIRSDFMAGALFSEKYIKEFAEWIGKNQYTYFNPKGSTPSWFDSEDRSLDCNTEELFKMFLDERSERT